MKIIIWVLIIGVSIFLLSKLINKIKK